MTGDETAVYLYGNEIGHIYNSSTSGKLEFLASGTGIDKFGLNSRVLSHSLPLSVKGLDARNFFGGLLPEGKNLDRLIRMYGESEPLKLLRVSGMDVAGAVTIRDPSVTELKNEYTPVSDSDIRQMLENSESVMGRRIGGGSSLTGFQDKITLARIDGLWNTSNSGGVSSHIIKPGNEESPQRILSEAYALDIARVIGLTTFNSEIYDFDGRRSLVIERYDRGTNNDGSIYRIHQEDMTQALNIEYSDDSKFEWYEPNMNLSAIAGVLNARGVVNNTIQRRREQTHRLLRYVTLNVAIGNTDAHGKNYSILRTEDGSTGLAPMYDISPQAFHYEGSKIHAMSLNGQNYHDSITREDIVLEGIKWGIKERDAEDIVSETLCAIINAVENSDPHPDMNENIPAYIARTAHNLETGRRAAISTSLPPSLLRKGEIQMPNTVKCHVPVNSNNGSACILNEGHKGNHRSR